MKLPNSQGTLILSEDLDLYFNGVRNGSSSMSIEGPGTVYEIITTSPGVCYALSEIFADMGDSLNENI